MSIPRCLWLVDEGRGAIPLENGTGERDGVTFELIPSVGETYDLRLTYRSCGGGRCGRSTAVARATSWDRGPHGLEAYFRLDSPFGTYVNAPVHFGVLEV